MTANERKLLLALAAWAVADGRNEATATISDLAHAVDAESDAAAPTPAEKAGE